MDERRERAYSAVQVDLGKFPLWEMKDPVLVVTHKLLLYGCLFCFMKRVITHFHSKGRLNFGAIIVF